ncbi:hypothetical protein PMAYCL1PPCAC_12818, partial [Pristionchus mayeri]
MDGGGVAWRGRSLSIGVIGDEERLRGRGVSIRVARVLSESSQLVGGSTVDENSLCVLDVLLLSCPLGEGGCLEGAAIREGQRPWLLARNLVDGVEVLGGLLLRLSSREEDHSGNCSRHRTLECSDRGEANFRVAGLVSSRHAGGAHVRLEESSLEEDVVLVEGTVRVRENSLRDLLASCQIVFSIGESLWFHDGHESVLLADRCIASKHLGDLDECRVGGSGARDAVHAAPLGKLSSVLLVLGASRIEIIESLGGSLSLSAGHRNHSLVNLDSRDDSLLLEHLHEGSSVVSLLVHCLVEEDDSGDVLLESLSGEEHLSVLPPVLLVVLCSDGGHSLVHRASRLVGRKDSLSLGDDGIGDGAKLVLLLLREELRVGSHDGTRDEEV